MRNLTNPGALAASLLIAISLWPTLSRAAASPDDNVKLALAQGTQLGVSVAAIPIGIFAPFPISTAAEVAGFGADLGLLHTAPIFDAPPSLGKFPNAEAINGKNCKYKFAKSTDGDSGLEGVLTGGYGSLFGIPISPLEDNFGDLGQPRVIHVGADVQVSAFNEYLTNDRRPEFPTGRFTIEWSAQSQMNPLLDIALPGVLLTWTAYAEYKAAQKAASTATKKAGTAAAKTTRAQRAKRIAYEAGREARLIATEQTLGEVLSEFNVGTTANLDFQSLTVWDETGPYFTSNSNPGAPISSLFISEPLEATDFGGVRLARAQPALLQAFRAVDDCGEEVRLELVNDINTILPSGERSLIEFRASEDQNGPFHPSYDRQHGQYFDGDFLRNDFVLAVNVQDTQAPLLVPPAGFASERTTPLPASEILGRSFPVGRPLVTDLADPAPFTDFVLQGGGTELALNQRHLLRWFSVDDSGNRTDAAPVDQSQFEQLVTLKTPGTNTAPSALATSGSGITSRPIEIQVGGTDADILPVAGSDELIADPLRFIIKDYPDNGEFEAPLYPYFISDYRLTPNGEAREGDNLSRVSPLGSLASGFNQQSSRSARLAFVETNICSTSDPALQAEFAGVIPRDFLLEATILQVLDDARVYAKDLFLYCTSTGQARAAERLSLWSDDNELLAMLAMNAQVNPAAGSEVPEPQWATEESTATGNEPFDYIGQRLTLDAEGNVVVNLRWFPNDNVSQLCFRTYIVDAEFTGAQSLGKECRTQAESGSFGGFPQGVALDALNGVNAIVVSGEPEALGAEPNDDVVRVYDASANNLYGTEGLIGTITTNEATLQAFSVAMDSSGAIYLLDRTEARVHKVSPTTRNPDGSWALGEYQGWLGKCDRNGLNAAGDPFSACDEEAHSSLGYACTDTKCLIDFDFGTDDVTGDGDGQFADPQQLAIDPNDLLYVADSRNERIQRFGPDGTFAGKASSSGTGFVIGNFGVPRNVTVNSSSMYVLVSDTRFSEAFLHSFKTVPFFDVTPNSAKLKYTSRFDHQGADRFTYAVHDGIAESAPAAVDLFVERNFRPPERLAVTCYADRPPAETTPCTTPEDGSGLYVELSAFDPDGLVSTGGLDRLTFAIENAPEHGELQELNQGTDSKQVYLYVPDADYHGKDEFQFSTTDGVAKVLAEASTPLTVTPTPDPAVITFDDELRAPRGFPFVVMAQYTDIDADDIEPALLQLNWGNGVVATPANDFQGSGKTDSNSREVSPQMHFGLGRGIVVGTHTYETLGQKTITVELSNASEGITESTLETARVLVEDAVVTAAKVTAPVAPVTPDQPFDLSIAITNLLPSTGNGLDVGDVVASFTLPDGVELLTGDSRCSGTVEVSCSLGALSSGATAEISMSARVLLANARENQLFDFSIKMTHNGPQVTEMNMGYAALEIADSDGDGVIDFEDAFAQNDRYSLDSDGDGLPDAWELAYGYDPLIADNTSQDVDGDGSSLIDEFNQDSFPELADEPRVFETTTFRRPNSSVDQAADGFGLALTHGDFDNDGLADVVMGSPADGSGKVYIYYGGSGTDAALQELAPVDSAHTSFGAQLATGDLNGNGLPDLIVHSTGGAYVYYNNGALLDTPDSIVNVSSGNPTVTIAVGDLDEDNLDDVVVSYNAGGSNPRAINMYLSANDTDVPAGENPRALDADSVQVRDDGVYYRHDSEILDIDGDGLNDLVFAANQSGAERVDFYFGSVFDWNNPGAFVPTRVLRGPAGQGRFGWRMAGGFDLGTDGITDLVVGSIGAEGTNEPGWVNVYNSEDNYWTGSLPQRMPAQIIQGRAGFVGGNDARADAFGASVALGQLDLDGHADLVVGASRAGAQDTGEVHVYRGTGSFAGNEPFAVTSVQIIEEQQAGSIFGRPVAAVGDTDGDGFGDLALAAPGFAPPNTPPGFVRLYRGGFGPTAGAQDQDGDGVRDSADSCPTVADTSRANTDGDALGNACDPDDDNDTLTDEYELIHGLDPQRADANEDFDGDGLSNLDEFQRGLSPSEADTDRDGIDDGVEIAQGSNPLFGDTDSDGIANTIDKDDDDDGLLDAVEEALGLNPLNVLDALADMDGDGFSNLAELQAQTGVNDIGSMPQDAAISKLVASVLPGHRSTQTGSTVTAFATIINTADQVAEGCSIVPLRPLLGRWSYSTTDPATNAADFASNVPASIEPGASQSYVFEVQPEETMSDELELRFDCSNTAAVNTITGLNTFGLTVTNDPAVDIVALTATASGNGIVEIDNVGGAAAFALASVNVGASGSVTARVRGAAGLPLVVGLCQTDSAGLCLNNQVPRADWMLDVDANSTQTFSVFVTATGDVALDPANNRIVVDFVNATGGRVGASSVAVMVR